MDLSIIIPLYNSAEYVESLVEQILLSSAKDISCEIVIIDDGSTDNSLDVLKRIIRNKTNVKVFSQENKGPSLAREYGVKKSSGDYLLFFDADDNFDPQLFCKIFNYAKNDNLDIVEYGYCVKKNSHQSFFSPQKNKFEHPIERFLHGKTSMFLWDKMFKRTVFENVTFYPFYYSEDAILLLQLYSSSNRLGQVQEPLYVHNLNSNSLTGQKKYNSRKIDQIRSGIEILSLIEEKKYMYKDYFIYYICKYSIKNCVEMRKNKLKNTEDYHFAKYTLKKHYSFTLFLRLFFKKEISLRAFLGLLAGILIA